MRGKQAKLGALNLLACAAFFIILRAVAEEKSVLEGANVVGTGVYTGYCQ